MSRAASKSLEQKALVSTFALITKVENLTDREFLPVLMLEPSLSAMFGIRAALHAGWQPVPPSPQDKITARLIDSSHPVGGGDK